MVAKNLSATSAILQAVDGLQVGYRQTRSSKGEIPSIPKAYHFDIAYHIHILHRDDKDPARHAMNNVTQNAAQAPKAVAHVATAAPKVAGRQAAQAPTLANKRARSFARAVHRPSYVRNTDPEDCEKGIIGGGKGWRVRSAQEGKSSEDEETRIGSEQSSRNEKESDPYDFPATYTKKSKDKEGNEVILLKFVEGDREDPLNWSRAYKWYVPDSQPAAKETFLTSVLLDLQVHNGFAMLHDPVHRKPLSRTLTLTPLT